MTTICVTLILLILWLLLLLLIKVVVIFLRKRNRLQLLLLLLLRQSRKKGYRLVIVVAVAVVDIDVVASQAVGAGRSRHVVGFLRWCSCLGGAAANAVSSCHRKSSSSSGSRCSAILFVNDVCRMDCGTPQTKRIRARRERRVVVHDDENDGDWCRMLITSVLLLYTSTRCKPMRPCAPGKSSRHFLNVTVRTRKDPFQRCDLSK